MGTMTSVNSYNVRSDSFLVFHREGEGFIGTDGTRFLRTAYHEDYLSPQVTRFNSFEAVKNYLSEVGVAYEEDGVFAVSTAAVAGPITEDTFCQTERTYNGT